MRITFEPTTKEQVAGTGDPQTQYPKVIVETPYDHLRFWELIEFIKGAIKAWGFSDAIVDRLTLEDEEDTKPLV